MDSAVKSSISRLSHYLDQEAEFHRLIEDNVNIEWKEGWIWNSRSKRQTYKLCDYRMPDEKRMPVYVQSKWGIPKPLTLGKDIQVNLLS